jgi:hypothetical protein
MMVNNIMMLPPISDIRHVVLDNGFEDDDVYDAIALDTLKSNSKELYFFTFFNGVWSSDSVEMDTLLKFSLLDVEDDEIKKAIKRFLKSGKKLTLEEFEKRMRGEG